MRIVYVSVGQRKQGMARKVDREAAEYNELTGWGVSMKLSRDVISVLRIPQWSKNFLVFLPALITHAFDSEALTAAVLAFAAFSVSASATYIFNDINDRVSDRVNNRTRHRVFAANQMEPKAGYVLIVLLLGIAGILATQLPWQFAIVLLFYITSSVAYTLLFKRMLGIDVVVIACLYVLRVIAGDEAIGAQFEGIDSSGWILGFSCLFFLSLAIVKRCSELATMREQPNSVMAGRAYRVEDYPVLLAFAAASAMASIAILIRYIGSPDVTENFGRPQLLWVLVPVLVYWLVRVILLANRGEITEDPVIFTLRDTKSQVCTVLTVLVTLVAW